MDKENLLEYVQKNPGIKGKELGVKLGEMLGENEAEITNYNLKDRGNI